jgi:hypothetical protein
VPLDQNLPNTLALLSSQGAFRAWQDPTIQSRWQDADGSGGIAAVMLQVAHMENIMDVGAIG